MSESNTDICAPAPQGDTDAASEIPGASTQAQLRVLLHDFVPYDRSINWSIQHNYYQTRGSAAWLEGEIPFTGTCNSAAAFQNACLVHAAASEMIKEGSLAPAEPIKVLEMASGVGMFAVNFIRAFGEIDRRSNTELLARLRYYFTDFSLKNLKEAAQNPVLADFAEKGVLSFYQMDALCPDQMQTLSGDIIATPGNYTAVISNYMHCCLPLTILRKSEGCFYEKQIRSSLILERPVENIEQHLKQIIENPIGAKVFSSLAAETTYEPATDLVFRSELHQIIIEKATDEFETASIIYPFGSMLSLERTLPLVRSGGIILITDKGHYNRQCMAGENEHEPSIHANSLAHHVNFPLLVDFLRQSGYAEQTSDKNLAEQTLFFEKRSSSRLSSRFNELFVSENINQQRCLYNRAAAKSMAEQDWSSAERLYLQAIDLAPFDADLCYHLGNCYYESGDIESGRKLYQKGFSLDMFVDRNFPAEIREHFGGANCSQAYLEPVMDGPILIGSAARQPNTCFPAPEQAKDHPQALGRLLGLFTCRLLAKLSIRGK